jgi:hypothetical protein
MKSSPFAANASAKVCPSGMQVAQVGVGYSKNFSRSAQPRQAAYCFRNLNCVGHGGRDMLGRRTRILGFLLLAGWLITSGPTLEGQTPTQPVQPAAAVQGPLDQPVAWMQEAKRNYSAVKDYTCTLVSQERVNGKLQNQNIMALKFRQQPFSVYMRWLQPGDISGQEVAFVAGKNNNKMRVNPKGGPLKNLAGWQNIDTNDRRVMEHSRHNILETGIGNLIDQMLKHWENDRKAIKTEVKTAEYKYQNRLCIRIETIRPDPQGGAYCYRCVLYRDKESKLPIRMEAYDWPRQGGAAEGELLETFSYVNLQFNVGLTDNDFNK